MKYEIVFLKEAESDLKALKNYMTRNFSKNVWEIRYQKIKNAVHSLKNFPQIGHIPPEIEHLDIGQYRQIISGINRIIYEIQQNIIYIHIICDTRQDMKSLLTRRLLRTI